MRASHAVFVVGADAGDAETWVRANRPGLRVMSAGRVIEIYKETGLPEEFVSAFALEPTFSDTREYIPGFRR